MSIAQPDRRLRAYLALLSLARPFSRGRLGRFRAIRLLKRIIERSVVQGGLGSY